MEDSPVLEIDTFGTPVIRLSGRTLGGFVSKKAEALLVYLAMAGRPVSRSVLADLFWEESTEERAAANLRVALSSLRKQLADFLESDRHTASVKLTMNVWVDALELERLLPTAELASSLALYKGPFLAGLHLRASSRFEEWQTVTRENLHLQVQERLHEEVESRLAAGDLQSALDYARRLMALDAFDEKALQRMMEILARSGQRNAALLQFESSQAQYREELGIEPSEETRRLAERIRQGETDGAVGAQKFARTPASDPERGTAPENNLPVQTTPFVGRAREIAQLEGLLADRDVHLITIYGPGGIGKTRLALAAAGRQLERGADGRPFRDGVFFISLAGVQSAGQLVRAVAQAVDFQFGGSGEPQEQLLRYLRRRALLLVLDNFEHLKDESVLVDEILRGAPQVTMLVTSRARLNRQAEYLLALEGLSYPRDGAVTGERLLANLGEYGALLLFVQCARRVRADFELTPDNLPSVVAIAQLVQGMPLGLALAAPWLETLALDEIVREIERDLDFLSTEMSDVPQRQRSVRATFNYSWRRLDKREQEVFQKLSVFRGGCDRQAAQAVTGAALHDLQALVQQSLLTLSHENRYEIHELLRQFAAEKLARSALDEREVRERHSAYYCGLLSERTEDLISGRQLEALAEITREAHNALAALDWALANQQWLRIRSALDSWITYYAWRGRQTDLKAFTQAIRDEIEGLSSDVQMLPAECVRLWTAAGAWLTLYAPTEAGLQRLEESLTWLKAYDLEDQDTRFEQAQVHRALGSPWRTQNTAWARKHILQSLALSRELGDEFGIALCLGSLADLDFAEGDYAASRSNTQVVLAMHQKRGDERNQLGCMQSLARLHVALGQTDAAERLWHKVLDICRKLNVRSPLLYSHADLALTLFWGGKFAEARQWAEKSLALCLEDGRANVESYARMAIACPLLFGGQYEEAQDELERCLALVKQAMRHREATVLWALGYRFLAAQKFAEAETAFAQSLVLGERSIIGWNLGPAWTGRGISACMQGDLAQARRLFNKALAHAVNRKDFIDLTMALPGVALYLAQSKRAARALEVWGKALQRPFVASSRWHADIVAPVLEELELEAEAREMALKRGESQDLWEMARELLGELG